MNDFFSRRNQVYPVIWNGQRAVQKYFIHAEDWKHEYDIYQALKLPHPKLLDAAEKTLTTAFCPYPTLLDILNHQEGAGFSAAPWVALASWILNCHHTLGQLPSEGNLRNFLWDGEHSIILGLDFENYHSSTPTYCGALLIANLLTYTPPNTAVKKKAADILSKQLQVSEEDINAALQELKFARNKISAKKFSGIILTGENSSRIEKSKYLLEGQGKFLLERQAEMLRSIGICDIMSSGVQFPEAMGIRTIPDLVPDRGYLGALHACLQASKNSQCVVVSLDMLHLPASIISKMCRAHEAGITILEHGGKLEPLIAVYDRTVLPEIEQLIIRGSTSMRELYQCVPWTAYPYYGPEEQLMDCNTSREYHHVQ